MIKMAQDSIFFDGVDKKIKLCYTQKSIGVKVSEHIVFIDL